MTKFISVDEVIRAHDFMVGKYGGAFGIRDEKLLESAVFRCQSSFGGKDLYRTIFEKAAAMFHSIIFDHPFVDGNKRTAVTVACDFLVVNGQIIEAGQEELLAFPLAVEKTRPEIGEIAKWFKKHCHKIRK